MSFFDSSVITSFGAFGRSKVLLGHAGTVLVTKDCHQLLHNTGKSDPLSKLILSSIKRHSDKYGDGGMTLTLLLSSVISPYVDSLGHAMGSGSGVRTKTLRCIENIIGTLHRNMNIISSSLIEAGLWFKCALDLKTVRNMCHHVLVPASNPEVAKTLTNILVLNEPIQYH